MNPKKNPCYKCEKRYVGCHDHCEAEAKWKAECAKEKAARKREQSVRNAMMDMRIDTKRARGVGEYRRRY